MKLENVTKKQILTTDLKLASSFSDQLLGLLKSSNPRFLLFKTRFGIHTFFLKEPIDVLILDQSLSVVKIGTNVRPNSFYFWNPKYNLVLELPEGVIKRSKTEIGDKLAI